MTQIKAVVQGDIPPNRLCKLTVQEEGLPILRFADDGFPHFRSVKELKDGDEIIISITNRPVWTVEAGEKILVGEAVYAGEEGKLFSRKRMEDTPADLMGYAANTAEEGELVNVVRSFQMNGNWLVKVNQLLDSNGGNP